MEDTVVGARRWTLRRYMYEHRPRPIRETALLCRMTVRYAMPALTPVPDRSRSTALAGSRRLRRSALLLGAIVAAVAALVAANVTGAIPSALAATSFTFDTGSGLVFTVDGGNGNMTSLRHNGTELA